MELHVHIAPQCQQTRSKHNTAAEMYRFPDMYTTVTGCLMLQFGTQNSRCHLHAAFTVCLPWTVSSNISNVYELGHQQHEPFFHVTLSIPASLTRTAAASSQHITACLHALADQHPCLPNQAEPLKCHACFRGHHSYWTRPAACALGFQSLQKCFQSSSVLQHTLTISCIGIMTGRWKKLSSTCQNESGLADKHTFIM